MRQNRPETGITLRVPECEAELLVSAPLAYYLGAEVVVESRDAALLTADGTSVHRSFDAWPSLQTGVAALLRKVFYIEYLVERRPGREWPRITSALSLEPDQFGRCRRLDGSAVIDVSDEAVNSILPEWPSRRTSHPTGAGPLSALPPDRLSLIYRPDSSRLDSGDLLDRTLGSRSESPFVRAPASHRADLREGQLHSCSRRGTR